MIYAGTAALNNLQGVVAFLFTHVMIIAIVMVMITATAKKRFDMGASIVLVADNPEAPAQACSKKVCDSKQDGQNLTH